MIEWSSLKEILVTGRETVTTIATALHKIIPQFEIPNISIFIVLLLSFLIVNFLSNMFFEKKSNLIIKLISTGILFYFLWLW